MSLFRKRSRTCPNISVTVPEFQAADSPRFKRITTDNDLKDLSSRLRDTPPNSASFKVEREIGKGTFSQVFEVTDIDSNEKSAIKVQSNDLQTDNRIISQHEIDILTILKKAKVKVGPEIKDSFYHKESNRNFIVMDLWEAVDFGDLTEVEQKEAIYQLKMKLMKIHSVGIVHNDIRIDNIIFRKLPTGKIEVGLIDWGESINIDSYSIISQRIARSEEFEKFDKMVKSISPVSLTIPLNMINNTN